MKNRDIIIIFAVPLAVMIWAVIHLMISNAGISISLNEKCDSITLLKKQMYDFQETLPYVDYYSQGIVVEVGINGYVPQGS